MLCQTLNAEFGPQGVHLIGEFGGSGNWTPNDDNALVRDENGYWSGFLSGVSDGDEIVATPAALAGRKLLARNLSDIAAMGGRPIALVNSLWASGETQARQLLAGLRRAADTFAVPMVGGHTNLHSPYTALAVAVLAVVFGLVRLRRWVDGRRGRRTKEKAA